MAKQEELPLTFSTYEVEVSGYVATSKTYIVKAESIEEAERIALAEVDADWEIHDQWKINAEIADSIKLENTHDDEDGY